MTTGANTCYGTIVSVICTVVDKTGCGAISHHREHLTISKDSILKSRDITLPTKVHLVKAMVFPMLMYGCESWTVMKAER